MNLSEINLNTGIPTILTTTNSPTPTCNIVKNNGKFDVVLITHPTITLLNIVGQSEATAKLIIFEHYIIVRAIHESSRITEMKDLL